MMGWRQGPDWRTGGRAGGKEKGDGRREDGSSGKGGSE